MASPEPVPDALTSAYDKIHSSQGVASFTDEERAAYEAHDAAVAERDDALAAAHHLHLTDAGNAELFVAMFRDLVRYDHARGRWLVWDTHRWRPDDDAAVNRMALESVRTRHRAVVDNDLLKADERAKVAAWSIRSEGRSRIEALLALARTMKPIADDGLGWDATPGLLGVGNGVVNLRTGELRAGAPEDRITMATAADYDPAAPCPRWDRFVLEICDEDAAVVAYLKRLAGYSLTGEANIALLLFLMGVGSNGKTRFLRTLARAFGDYAYALPASVLTESGKNAHRHYLAEMEGKRFVICPELGDDELNADRLKSLSGDDGSTADLKFQRAREFPQTWQLWLTSNKQPRSDDNTVGFWRRVRVAPFVRQFEENAEPGLKEKLWAEREGVLRWAVEGAVEFYAAGMREGEKPDAIVEGTAEYRDVTDSLSALFEQGYLVKDADCWTSSECAYLAYQAFASQHEIALQYRLSPDGLSKRLADQYARKSREFQLADGRVERRGFLGLRVGDAAPAETWSFDADRQVVLGGHVREG